MTMITVRTPVAGFTGDVGKVHFLDGVAEVPDDAQELTYMRNAGYLIEDPDAPVDDDEAPVIADVDGDGVTEELPKKSASAEVWRAFAAAHGMTEDEAAAMSRDALVAHYYAQEGGSE